jgi:hypothetical protein
MEGRWTVAVAVALAAVSEWPPRGPDPASITDALELADLARRKWRGPW